MTDEQRFDAVGYANSSVKTPCLDVLAEESLVFRSAYTTNPSCIPARAAVFTWKVPSQCGAPTFITSLPENEICFQSLLQDAGVYTAMIGKQHLAGSAIPHTKSFSVREDIYMEDQDVRAIRVGNLKLIHYARRDYGELFDLDMDPWEKQNLWGDPEHREQREHLRTRLLDKLISFETHSDMPWNVQAPPI